MPRKILESMREQRLKDLHDYENTINVIDGISLDHKNKLIREREALLNLEFPFKTDMTSLMEAYKIVNSPKEPWNSKENASKLGLPVDETWQRNSSFNALKKHQILPIYYQTGDQLFEVPVEDFHLESVHQMLRNRILDSDLEESMKAKLCSKLNSLRRHHTTGYAVRVNRRDRDTKVIKNIDLLALSGFFKYLEDCFLQSGSSTDLLNIIVIRLAFYVDIPIRGLAEIELGNLQHEKDNWYSIITEKYSKKEEKLIKRYIRFRLPFSFFKLLKAGFKTENEKIFPFSEKTFYKLTISLFGKYQQETSLQTDEVLSPKILKCSLANLCHERKLPSDSLPNR